jgi:putative redox protein
MDIGLASGGDNAGFKPMHMLLVGLGGCMGIDVKIILSKMKLELNDLKLEIIGELDESTTPRIYNTITINFYISGENLEVAKIEKAIKLAEDKYCNVSAILSKSADLVYNTFII